MFQSEQLLQCINITIVDDTFFEGLENFLFQITPVQTDRAIILLSARNAAVVSIVDPEDGMLKIAREKAERTLLSTSHYSELPL